jgi:hypothetical protein
MTVRQSNDRRTAGIQNPAINAGSRPAMPGQTYKPPVQHLAAFQSKSNSSR